MQLFLLDESLGCREKCHDWTDVGMALKICLSMSLTDEKWPGIKVTWALLLNPKSIYPPEQGPECPPPSPELNWVWSRAQHCTWPWGCHTWGFCIPWAPTVARPAQGSDTPALWGAQCPTCSCLWASSLSSIPKCRSVVWPPRAASGARWVFGSSLRKLLPPEESMQIVGGSSCLHRGEASPGSLLPSGKPLECEKRHLSCQGGLECKQPLCPAHPAGSQLSTCTQEQRLCSHTAEPTGPQLPFPGTLVPKLDT